MKKRNNPPKRKEEPKKKKKKKNTKEEETENKDVTTHAVWDGKPRRQKNFHSMKFTEEAWTDGLTDGRMNRRKDKWMDGRTERRTYE